MEAAPANTLCGQAMHGAELAGSKLSVHGCSAEPGLPFHLVNLITVAMGKIRSPILVIYCYVAKYYTT